MAKRKADWSLIDAQMKARDSQDRQGRFLSEFLSDSRLRTGFEGTFANRVAHAERALDPGRGRVRRQAMSRPSNYQQRRASGQRSNPSIVGRGTPMGEVTSARATYSYPDAASISSRPSNTEDQYLHSFRVPGATQDTRAAATAQPSYSPYSRQSSVQSHLPEVAKAKRQASTQAAYHLADSAPLKDYKPRGKTVRDKNIQAFY